MVKKEISFLDLFKWLNENSFLNQGRIREVRSQRGAIFILIYKLREYWLKIVPGKYIALEYSKPSDLKVSDFDRRIENAFGNRRISVSLHNSDRIIEISSDDTKLVIELFSNGNVILLKDDLIEWSMYSRDYGARKISSNRKYEYPPGSRDVTNLSFDEFKDLLLLSNKSSVVKSLAVDFFLGGKYANELCFRSGLKGDEPISSLEEDKLNTLYKNFTDILKEEVKPNIINDEIFSSVELTSLSGNKVYFSSINDAMLFFFEHNGPQKENLNLEEKLKDTIEDKQSTIAFLNENFDIINNIIDSVRNSSKSLVERKEYVEKNGWELDGKFIVHKSPDIKIDITKPLNSTISDLYDSIKRVKKKLSGEKTEKRPIKLKSSILNVWYEKFRWFYTSSNKLGVLGKDNNQNIALIKKYASPSDVVLHADIFGSPFCILKNASIDDEDDIREAAIMTASYSSAWKNGLTAVDVFYVRPDQVTLSPPSGESLKSGAFYISGKRNYVKNAQLGIYLNLKINDDKYDLLPTPKPYYRYYFSIKPGNKKREDIIDKIHDIIIKRLNFDIDKNDINKFIPNGRCTIDAVKLD